MARLVRDSSTWLTYGQLAIFAYFLYGISPAIALLRDEQHVSSAVAGLHGTAMAAGSLVAGSTSAWIAGRIGRGRAIWAGLAGLAASVAGLCLLRPIGATITCTLFAAIFGVSLVSGVVAGLGERYDPHGATAIAEGNAIASGVGALAPLVIGLTVAAGLTWRPAVAVVILLVLVCGVLAKVLRIRIPAGAAAERRALSHRPAVGSAAEVPEPGLPGWAELDRAATRQRDSVTGETRPAGDPPGSVRPRDEVLGELSLPVAAGTPPVGRLPVGYWMAWLLLALTGSVEVCLNLWSGDVLRAHAGMSPGAAATTVSGIIGGMCLGRLVGGRIALRVPAPKLLLCALALSLLGFVLFWVAAAPVLAVTGLVVLGLGNGMHYPLGIGMALRASDGRPDQAAARASYGMVVSFGIAPLALGMVADRIGARTAFLLVPALLLAAAALVGPLARRLPPAGTGPAAHRVEPVSAAVPG